MNNFNYSSDYHFGPLNAFPICGSDWHQGLCYQRILLSSSLLKWAFPPQLQGHFLSVCGLGRAQCGADNSTACINGLWGKAVLSAQGGNATERAGTLNLQMLPTASLKAPILWLLQASCPTSAASRPPARTAWPTVWRSSRRSHSAIKTRWRNFAAQ